MIFVYSLCKLVPAYCVQRHGAVQNEPAISLEFVIWFNYVLCTCYCYVTILLYIDAGSERTAVELLMNALAVTPLWNICLDRKMKCIYSKTSIMRLPSGTRKKSVESVLIIGLNNRGKPVPNKWSYIENWFIEVVVILRKSL